MDAPPAQRRGRCQRKGVGSAWNVGLVPTSAAGNCSWGWGAVRVSAGGGPLCLTAHTASPRGPLRPHVQEAGDSPSQREVSELGAVGAAM